MKKNIRTAISLLLVLLLMTGCQSGGAAFNADSAISLNSREGGSGTRSAFVELFGITQEIDGETYDMISLEAAITNNTSVMMMTISGDRYAIGYISLGSLNDTVKPLNIDGAAPTAQNIEDGSYKIARPFNIATTDSLSEAAADFVDFICSDEGQEIVEQSGYIPIPPAGEYTPKNLMARVVVAGSSSVAPVMEKLKEAYIDHNPNTTVELQQSDSSTGINAVAEGICDIGMASRALKQSELDRGLFETTIARDGIVIIVNEQNPVSDLSAEQVKRIFTGEILSWAEVL